MHNLVFLGARLPLTKTFVQANGVLTASPYPHVSKMTSHHEQFDSLQGFHDLLTTHAALDHCLFNGQLTAPLQNESRAGKTKAQPRPWVVFDFDKVKGRSAADVVSTYLPAECQNVSYVSQLSASMFRPDSSHWSGHIFMLLKEPIEAQRLRQWFEWLNFNHPALEQSLSLSDSTQALHWPLDRTVAYDSKLIYIAPPRCFGFKPAVEQHITLVKKRQPSLSIPTFTPIDTVTIRQKINHLRRNAGLNDIDYEIQMFEGHEMLRKTDVCDVHGIKSSGDHYIRFNLNGGDSYAYFIDLRNPDVIRNFKGEPFLLTRDAAPDLYKALRIAAPKAVAKAPLEDSTEVLAFYATNQNSSIKVGMYSPVERRLVLNTASETAARAWMAEYGLVQKGYLPHYDLIFDPQSDIQYLAGTNRINTFRATEYMANAKKSSKPTALKDIPPIASKILRSVLGNPNDELLSQYVNWLAYIFQFRKKTSTAWVLNGVEGTGKGLFVKYYLAPIFGPEQIISIQFSNIKGEFNDFLENRLFVVFEEADVKAVENSADLMSKLRMWIADEEITIRKMRTDPYSAKSYCNFLFHTNERTPAVVTGTDRRFNFGERQDQRLYPTPNEMLALAGGTELEAFAHLLHNWPVDVTAVTRIVDTQARRDAHEASVTINQTIAEAILQGDLQFFIDRMPSETEAAADYHNRFNPLGMYKQLIDQYIHDATTGVQTIVSDEQLFTLFRTLIPDTRFFQDNRTWRKRHYKSLGLDVDKQHRTAGSWDKRSRGVAVKWAMPTDLPPAVESAPVTGSNVTPMAKRSRKT